MKRKRPITLARARLEVKAQMTKLGLDLSHYTGLAIHRGVVEWLRLNHKGFVQ